MVIDEMSPIMGDKVATAVNTAMARSDHLVNDLMILMRQGEKPPRYIAGVF